MVLEGLRKLLAVDFEVVGAVKDGRALLAAAEIQRPDLIVVDISMPGIDGIEANRRLRDLVPEARVLILSFHSEPSWVHTAFEAGARGYLTKTSARASSKPSQRRNVMKRQLILFLTLALLCVGAGAALAQTPDHMPPSRETVCDNETGAAYGLCNAYCEAMDCELANDGDPLTAPKASSTACTKVRTKFQNITGRDVPCELPCPCLGIPKFNAFLATMNYCFESANATLALVDLSTFEYIGTDSPASTNTVRACGYVNLENSQASILLPITAVQAAACLQAIDTAAANRGVTCQPFPE